MFLHKGEEGQTRWRWRWRRGKGKRKEPEQKEEDSEEGYEGPAVLDGGSDSGPQGGRIVHAGGKPFGVHGRGTKRDIGA
jgi:hypothetical protein